MSTEELGVIEWENHPATHSMIAPLAVARDPRLSAKAKGIMLVLLTLPPDGSLGAEAVVPHIKDGRDAARAGLSELEAFGYITRSRTQSNDGKWTTRTVIHPYGQPMTGFPASVSPASDEPTPVNPALSSSYLSSTTSNEVAAAVSNLEVGGAANLDGAAAAAEDVVVGPGVTSVSQIPWTEVHLLRSWFRVEQPELVEAWQQAWRTGVSVASADYDPQTHLNAYLTRCREERREPKPSRWLKFLIEDRARWLAQQRSDDDRREQEAAADGGESWALRSLSRTPDWKAGGQ